MAIPPISHRIRPDSEKFINLYYVKENVCMGADRYSIPTCRPMQTLGNVCRPSGQVPYNTTVGYPDQSQVELSVFWLFCPCAEGLYCQRESHSCQAVY
ncbi:Astakine [Gryllus bimaculatus]|nr:Astakine [Gryllus bimaculatus]